MSFGFLLAEKSGVGSSNTERHFRHQDGSWLPALLSGSAIYQPDGTFEQVVLSAKDISEQYRQREKLEQAVVERTRELEQTKKEAEEANQAKSRFLSRMSHEIRTPIHGIIGSLDLLSPDTLSTDQQLQIQQAETSANHLLGVINEILDFSRLEAGQMTYSSQPFDLGQTCQQVLGLLRPLAEDKGLSLQLEWAPDLAAARQGDQQKLRQVLINLVANAIKFSTEGSIRLKVESLTAERLRLEVVDTGPGIPAEEQQRLFEAFSQLDETATRAQGALV
jgi:signal transduction histidine kinase